MRQKVIEKILDFIDNYIIYSEYCQNNLFKKR